MLEKRRLRLACPDGIRQDDRVKQAEGAFKLFQEMERMQLVGIAAQQQTIMRLETGNQVAYVGVRGKDVGPGRGNDLIGAIDDPHAV